ncbi:MAG: hypothetical protein RBR09_04465 [Desulfobulbaceae bacterium]|nr:hypothetical protein [Desulfobulbaceae bacterium]MDY0350487.1 hypothetical protein [Desulfobulbaceae bacterium]
MCTPFCPKKIITTDARGYPRITAADSLLVINSTLVEQSPTSWVIGVLSRQVSLEHPTAALLARIPPDSRKRTKWRLTWGLKKVK